MDDNDSTHESDSQSIGNGDGNPTDSSLIDELLRDPKKKELVLEKLGLSDDSSAQEAITLTLRVVGREMARVTTRKTNT